MGAGIVRVMNNTNHTLHYHNTESGVKFDIGPKTDQYENNDWIPSSDYKYDSLPSYSSGKSIQVSIADLTPMLVTNDGGKFSIVYPTENSGETAQNRSGDVNSGWEYIIRMDQLEERTVKKAAMSIYKYEAPLGVTPGYIALQLIQQAAPIVVLVLMAIFL
ncbi:hypothetical protein DL768_001450 [Monosporascus sp. mg162]|nr:hypothetical protein DL768_001450 [Monosporascus sp. mg162]